MQIQEKRPEQTHFEWIGGEARIQALVTRFYDLMDSESEFAVLRATHSDNLENSRQRLFWFLCGWMGGPQYYMERFGHPKLRQRHLRVPIGIVERDQWVACMNRAMEEIGVPEDLYAQLKASFFKTADFMRNTET